MIRNIQDKPIVNKKDFVRPKKEKNKEKEKDGRLIIEKFIEENQSYNIRKIKSEAVVPSQEAITYALQDPDYQHPLAEFSGFNIIQFAEIYKIIEQIYGRDADYVVTGGLYNPNEDQDVFWPTIFVLMGLKEDIEKISDLDGKFLNEFFNDDKIPTNDKTSIPINTFTVIKPYKVGNSILKENIDDSTIEIKKHFYRTVNESRIRAEVSTFFKFNKQFIVTNGSYPRASNMRKRGALEAGHPKIHYKDLTISLNDNALYLRDLIYCIALYRYNKKMIRNLSLYELGELLATMYHEKNFIELDTRNNAKLLKSKINSYTIHKMIE